ncbi:MAG: FecR domain-containing protein [Candidatus Eiseniibacteriota bacterium]
MGSELTRDPDRLDDAGRRASEAVRALPRPAADPDFRARLVAEFTSGEIARAPRRIQVIRLPWHRREMTRWALASAAATALVVAVLALNQGPSWRVVSRHGHGLASIDGREIPLGSDEFDHLLHAGVQLALPADGDLMLQAGDQMMLAVDPGSVVTLPEAPGRWFARRVHGRVDEGTMRVSTGAAFRGAALALMTPEAQVRVTGTTFAVICEPAGTCVCVLEGVVRVGPLGAAMADVPGGMRGYVYANGAPMAHATMRPDETVKLGELREKRDARMEHSPR